MMEGAIKHSQSAMDEKGMPGEFNACNTLVVPVRGKDTMKTGRLMTCFLKLGKRIQSIARAMLFNTRSAVNKGANHIT
jgi:hypothetical protein